MSSRMLAAHCLAWSLLAAGGLADDYSETLSDAEKALLAAMNKERQAEDVPALKVNGKLMAASRIHARNMAAADTGGHVLEDVRAEWRKPEDRLTHVGYRGYAWGENVAWSYPRAEMVTAGWMKSEGHRRNILNADFLEVGLGVARGKSGPYWCAVFGRSSPAPVRSETDRPSRKPTDGERKREDGPTAESWRYRWHEGRWWYWLPSGRWAVWMDGRWVEFP
jgi:hypothetical protein